MLASSVLRQSARNALKGGLRTSRISSSTLKVNVAALRSLSTSVARFQELEAAVGDGLATPPPPPPSSSPFAGIRPEVKVDAKELDGKLESFAQLRELGLVDKSFIDVLTDDYKYDKMTDVQSATISEGLKGHDMFVFQINQLTGNC